MYFDELLQKAYVKAEGPVEDEIILLPAGFRPTIEMGMYISKADFESVLMNHRANEPASEAVLTTIGTECRAGVESDVAPQVWDMLVGRPSVLDRYAHLCNEQAVGSLDALGSAESSHEPTSEPDMGEAPSFEDLEAYRQDGVGEPAEAPAPAPASDSIVLGDQPEEEPAEEPAPQVPAMDEQDDGLAGFGFGFGEPAPAPEVTAEESAGLVPGPMPIEGEPDAPFGFPMDSVPGAEETGITEPTVPAVPTADAIGGLGEHVDPWDVEDTMVGDIPAPQPAAEAPAQAAEEPAPAVGESAGFEGFGFDFGGFGEAPQPEQGASEAPIPAEASSPAEGEPEGFNPWELDAPAASEVPTQQEEPAGVQPAPMDVPTEPEMPKPAYAGVAGSLPNSELKDEPEDKYSEELQEIQELFDLFFTRCKEYGIDRIIGSNGTTPEAYALQLVAQFPILAPQLGNSLQAHQGQYDAVVLDLISILRAEAEIAVKKGDLEGGSAYGQPVYSILYE